MVRTINLSYNQTTRTLSANSDLAGSSADVLSTVFSITPIANATIDLVADMSVMVGGVRISSPFARFDASGNTKLPPYVLKACKGSIELNVRVTYDDGTVENSSQIILDVANVPDVLEMSADSDLMMTRNGSWNYISTWTYNKGSVAIYNNVLYTSKKDGNVGHTPSNETNEWWTLAVDVSSLDLSSVVEAEATARSSADTALGARIDSVEGDITDIETSVTDEATARTSADTALQASITAEVTARQTADTNLQTAIEAETARATEAEQELYDGLITVRDDAIYVLQHLGTASQKNTGTSAGNVPVIGNDGKLPSSIIPTYEITTYAGTVSSQEGLAGLTAEVGDYAIVTDVGTFFKDTSGWIKISGVGSEGRWGTITGTLSQQTDLQTALNGKVDTGTFNTTKTGLETAISGVSTRVTTLENRDCLSSADADGRYQPIGSYATTSYVDTAVSDKVTMTEVRTELSAYQPAGNYLTEHQSLAGYVTTGEISDMLTQTVAQATYQPIGNYLTQHQSLADYALKSDITAVYKAKGSVDSADDLPTENMAVGDVYNATDTGMNWVYTEEGWDALGATVDLSDYQEKLTAGTGITIQNGTISASGSKIVTSTTEPASADLWICPTGSLDNYDTEAF